MLGLFVQLDFVALRQNFYLILEKPSVSFQLVEVLGEAASKTGMFDLLPVHVHVVD